MSGGESARCERPWLPASKLIASGLHRRLRRSADRWSARRPRRRAHRADLLGSDEKTERKALNIMSDRIHETRSAAPSRVSARFAVCHCQCRGGREAESGEYLTVYHYQRETQTSLITADTACVKRVNVSAVASDSGQRGAGEKDGARDAWPWGWWAHGTARAADGTPHQMDSRRNPDGLQTKSRWTPDDIRME